MIKNEFLRLFETTLSSAPEEQLNGTELCSALDGWDSMSVLSFIAMVDKELGIVLEAESLYTCETVDDLFLLVADRPAT